MVSHLDKKGEIFMKIESFRLLFTPTPPVLISSNYFCNVALIKFIE